MDKEATNNNITKCICCVKKVSLTNGPSVCALVQIKLFNLKFIIFLVLNWCECEGKW